jgi:hypothetical protein
MTQTGQLNKLLSFKRFLFQGEEMLKKVIENRVNASGADEDDKVCTLCMCVPESGDKYVYELCGHPCCKSCLKQQVRSGDIPIKCSKEVGFR